MPYISTESVKTIRNRIKKEFPNVKFSIVREHCCTVIVSVMQSNIDFGLEERDYKSVNTFYVEEHFAHNEVAKTFLLKLMKVIDEEHPETEVTYDYDYGSIPNYYLDINIGKWDKPYVRVI